MTGPLEKLPDEARRMIEETGIAYVATVNPDGSPNLSPKGTLKVIGDAALAFADIASPGTMRNLAQNPAIEINVLDPFLRRGYRFRGRATVSQDPALIALLGEGLAEQYPIRAAARIDVQAIRPLISPIYTLFGASEETVRRKWEEKLGYRRLPAAG